MGDHASPLPNILLHRENLLIGKIMTHYGKTVTKSSCASLLVAADTPQ